MATTVIEPEGRVNEVHIEGLVRMRAWKEQGKRKNEALEQQLSNQVLFDHLLVHRLYQPLYR